MSEPFLGEVKLMSFNFPPKGWAPCNGQLLPINQNQALFSLLGTMYGGDGRTTFALPDLRGKVPVHIGAGFTQGQTGGQVSHTVTISEMPQHLHFLQASATDGNTPVPGATQPSPTPNVLARTVNQIYGPASALDTLAPASVSSIGGSQPHDNRQPYLVVNFCIALIGIFPSQT